MNTQELQSMTVVALRSLAKENHIRLNAGIDKAGIIEKLSEVLCTSPETQNLPETDKTQTQTDFSEQPVQKDADFDPLGASADVTAAAPSYRQWVSQQSAAVRTSYQNTGWQNRSALREQSARTTAPWQQRAQANHRFGPQSRTAESANADEASRQAAPVIQQAPSAPVSADGYRLGYRAAPQRSSYAPKDRGDYDATGNRPYQARQSYGSASYEERGSVRAESNPAGLSDSIYRMNRSTEFDNQRLQGVMPSLLQPMETVPAGGILEIMSDGFGFLRSDALTPSKNDIYMSPAINRRYNLRTGDTIQGTARKQRTFDRYSAMLTIDTINGLPADENATRPVFDQLTATYPDKRICLESKKQNDSTLRLVDFVAPIGYGQRGLISAPPDSGALTLLTSICGVLRENDPDIEVLMLLIDEAPEAITEIREKVDARVFSSTFTDSPDSQTRICETMLEYAQRLVENKKNVVVLLDSITKLAKAYQAGLYQGTRPITNAIAPAALVKPMRFFGSARNVRGGGSLTVIATISIETDNHVDEIIHEEFKSTANMDLVLCSPKEDDPIFPMVQLSLCGTKKDTLLLNDSQREALNGIRTMLRSTENQLAVKKLIEMMEKTKSNEEFTTRILHWLSMLNK